MVRCTYINFSKDLQCELCLTPRPAEADHAAAPHPPPQPQPSNSSSSQTSYTSSSSNLSPKSIAKQRWVCKRCTYFNANSETKCILCNTQRELSYDSNANTKEDMDAFSNQRTSSTASTTSSNSSNSSSNGSTSSSSSSTSSTNSTKQTVPPQPQQQRLVLLDEEWICEICS